MILSMNRHEDAIRISIGMCRRMNPLLSSFSPGTTVFRYFWIRKPAYPTDPVESFISYDRSIPQNEHRSSGIAGHWGGRAADQNIQE